MTPSEIRKEIYSFIYDNILNKELDKKSWYEKRKYLSKLLIKFGSATNPELIQKKPKNKTFGKISQISQKEKDIKNGIWRPDEFYR